MQCLIFSEKYKTKMKMSAAAVVIEVVISNDG